MRGRVLLCMCLRSEAVRQAITNLHAFHNQAERVASNVDLNQLARWRSAPLLLERRGPNWLPPRRSLRLITHTAPINER